ncbi:hypothetical protein LCGC14_1816790 [marine sediment metagenome]|uniref:RNA polymerase sigma-70 region 4 domain-containing protein n=1 Tax=marine sediment metagenome TaxID=412755 RepID=A0A0F9H884_9ZZZZ
MNYRMKDKKDRNARLVKFAKEHPDYTQEAIAKIFRIHRSRVSRILQSDNV